MVKKIVGAVLALTLIIQAAPIRAEDFSDWQKPGIEYVKEHHIMEGISSDSFAPNELVTRAQFAVALSRFFLLEKESDLSAFQDVIVGSWYESGMKKAYTYNLLKGYANQMRPNDPLTREEIFVILNRLMQLEIKANVQETQWADREQIATWASKDIQGLDSYGYLRGRENGLAPKSHMKRAELAVLLLRIFPQIVEKDGAEVSNVFGNIVVRGRNVKFKSGDFPTCMIFTPPASNTDYTNLQGKEHIVFLGEKEAKKMGVIEKKKTSISTNHSKIIRDSGHTVKPIINSSSNKNNISQKQENTIENIIDVERTGVAKNGDIGTFVLIVFKKAEYAKEYKILIDGEDLKWSKVDDSGRIIKAEVNKLDNKILTLQKGSESPLSYHLLQFYN